MELPDLGKKCADDQCSQLDFLPLQCTCGRVFCSEHLRRHVQACEKSRFLTEDELKNIQNLFVCSMEGCKERSIVPLVCERCKKHYCIKHRHLTVCEEKTQTEIEKEKKKYAQPLEQFNKAKAFVDQEVDNSLAEAKKKSKNKEMATKLQLMKIKNKATGQKSIPTTERVFFNIIVLPISHGFGKTVPVFVSKAWSVGRVIDAVADECKVQNNNHKSAEKKLRLFKKCDNEIICTNLAESLNRLILDKVIVDGDDLIIEFVDDSCVSL